MHKATAAADVTLKQAKEGLARAKKGHSQAASAVTKASRAASASETKLQAAEARVATAKEHSVQLAGQLKALRAEQEQQQQEKRGLQDQLECMRRASSAFEQQQREAATAVKSEGTLGRAILHLVAESQQGECPSLHRIVGRWMRTNGSFVCELLSGCVPAS